MEIGNRMEKKENWILGDWRQAVLTQTATIHDAIQVLNEVALKIVMVVDEAGGADCFGDGQESWLL